MDQQADHSETPILFPDAEPRQDDEWTEPGPKLNDSARSGPAYVGSAPRTVVSSGEESVRAADPTLIAQALRNAAPRESFFFDLDIEPDREAPPVSPVESNVEVVSGTSDALREPENESNLSAAQIVGSAIQEIISDLTSSILRAAQAAGDVDSTTADLPAIADSQKSQNTPAPADDDHSYQWHAFQEDDDAVPVTPWGEEEAVLTAAFEMKAPPVSPLAVSRFTEASTTQSEISDTHSDEAVPTHSTTVPDGMLDYESVPAVIIRGGGWTFPVLCAGICIIACCLLIPICDANRRAAYEKLRLRRDLESLQLQVAVNDEFLRKVADDPTLAERLAQRQLHKIRAGTHFLPLKDDATAGQGNAGFGSMSAFGIVAVPPPPPLEPYQPVSGPIARLCYNPHSRLYFMGAGMMLLAAGLVMGYGPIGAKTNQ